MEQPPGESVIHVEIYGRGRPVVLLHGVPSSPADFAPLADRLATRRRVVVPHLPGYGRTPAQAPATLVGTTLALEETLLGLGVESADFVAFSGGAYKAVLIALRARVAVGKLVLLAPVVGLDPDHAQAFRELAGAVLAGRFDPRPSWLARMAAPGLSDRDPAAARAVLAWLDAAPMEVVCDELVASADAPDLRPRLRDLACDLLVCSGTADAAVPPILAEAVARSVRGARYHSIVHAGHALLLEAPDEVIHAIEDFLSA